jgi:pyrrolidone-carboxylate peptidase
MLVIYFLANILYSEKMPVEVSANADNFICNSLGYLTTKKILDNNLNIRNMFIHIPWTDNYKDKIVLEPGKIFLEKEKVYTAIKLLIKNICH